MRTRVSTLLVLTSAGLLLFFCASCGGPAKQIVGQWKMGSGTSETTWEFFPNKSLTTDGAPGHYTFGDNNRIKIQTATATFVYQFEIQGDTMSWTATDGSKMRFTRAR